MINKLNKCSAFSLQNFSLNLELIVMRVVMKITALLMKLERLVRISVGVKQSIALDARMRNGTPATQDRILSHPAKGVVSSKEISVSLI